MDAQAEAAESITPEVIGHAFVSQFYSILHQTPELVHRFYEDTSIMSRPARDGSLTTVTNMKDINELMLSLDCKEYKAEIMTADTQASHQGGVIVFVTGCLTGKDNVRRNFSEAFFLAPQTNGYYVLNDAFRFIDEDVQPTPEKVQEPEEKAVSSTIAIEPEVVEITEKSLPILTATAEPVSNGKVDVSDKPEEQAVKEPVVVDPSVELVNHVDEQVVAESSPDVKDGPKKSYASIVKKESTRTTPVKAPPTTVKNSSANNGNQTRVTTASAPKPQANGNAPAEEQLKEAAKSTSVPDSSASNGNTKYENGVDKVEEKGYSIYIGNLPYDSTVEHVEEEFKKFGTIKRGGIQVRCSQGFCFGFVEYESLTSAQKAIESSPIRIGEYEAFVQEKKTSTRVVNGVPTFSGRGGGYRNGGFRGRGNFSGGRGGGYGRNDYGRRGDYGNGGGRGDYGNGGGRGDYGNGGGRNGDGYHRGGYQNGGGRTGIKQQGGAK